MDEIPGQAGIFQGVEPSAIAALTKQLPVDFPVDTSVFAGRGAGRSVTSSREGRFFGWEKLRYHQWPSLLFMSCRFSDLVRARPARPRSPRRAVLDRDSRSWIADRPEISEQLLRVLPAGCAAPTTWPTSSFKTICLGSGAPAVGSRSSPSVSAPRRWRIAGHPRTWTQGRPAGRGLTRDGEQGTG